MWLFVDLAMTLRRVIALIASSNILLTTHSRAESFHLMRFPNGTQLCAGGEPSVTASVAYVDYTSIHHCLAARPQFLKQFAVRSTAYYCAYLTATGGDEGACNGFNYLHATKRCDFFSTATVNCTFQLGCTYYSVRLPIGRYWTVFR